MKTVIATGIYPPEIGGPAEYARQLYETLLIQDREAVVVTYAGLKKFPTGLRHFLYFCKLFFDALDADYVIALDTWSAAIPAAFFAKILRKKFVVRVGGDFLWEAWVERTGQAVLLSEFYKEHKKFKFKEGIIFIMTKWLLKKADRVVFSTDWQRQIWTEPYCLDTDKTTIIENYFPKTDWPDLPADNGENNKKIFLAPSRSRTIKNRSSVEKAFRDLSLRVEDIELDSQVVSREVLLEKIQKSYAVIVASLSEVSPNLVCDAFQYGVPVVLTYDNGMRHRFENKVIFVDPLSWTDIERGVETLLDRSIYQACRRNIVENDYSRSWNEIVEDFLNLYEKI